MVWHAGTVLLGELADRIGLTATLSEVVGGLRSRRAGHDPGRVLVDVVVAIADGATTISDVQVLAEQHDVHGPAGSIASTPTVWRVLAGIDASMLAQICQARALARDRASPARGELTSSKHTGMDVRLIYRRDRYLRGGDHIAFLRQVYAAARFTEPNEDYAHQHQDVRTEGGHQFSMCVDTSFPAGWTADLH